MELLSDLCLYINMQNIVLLPSAFTQRLTHNCIHVYGIVPEPCVGLDFFFHDFMLFDTSCYKCEMSSSCKTLNF